MANTHDIGRLFFHVIRVRKGTPFAHRAETNEIDGQYRTSNSVVVRIGFRSALVLGWWKFVEGTEDERLMRAVRADLAPSKYDTHTPLYLRLYGDDIV